MKKLIIVGLLLVIGGMATYIDKLRNKAYRLEDRLEDLNYHFKNASSEYGKLLESEKATYNKPLRVRKCMGTDRLKWSTYCRIEAITDADLLKDDPEAFKEIENQW